MQVSPLLWQNSGATMTQTKPEWATESPLHEECWALGLCESETRTVLDCGNIPQTTALATCRTAAVLFASWQLSRCYW